MIKIRYRDPNELSPGLHAAAERHGRSTTVYLLPGLSSAQRRAALRRLTISASRGYDPRLPAPQLALALLADRIRTTVGRAGAVFRSHPAGSTVPVMVVSAGAIVFLALSAVSIQVIRTPSRGAGQVVPAVAWPAASFSAGPGPVRSAGPLAEGLNEQPGLVTDQSGPPGSAARQQGVQARGSNGTGSASGDSSGNETISASPPASSGGGTTLGGAVPRPSAGGDPTSAAPATSSAAAADTPGPAPTPTASQSGLCVNVGSLGLCV
jgi:hypothetical protein